MRKLIVLALVGLAAQLVDGSLGMGYGVTSSTLLVALAGLTPAAASASVHISEIVTNAASGVSHWRLKNVDWRVVARIAGEQVTTFRLQTCHNRLPSYTYKKFKAGTTTLCICTQVPQSVEHILQNISVVTGAMKSAIHCFRMS